MVWPIAAQTAQKAVTSIAYDAISSPRETRRLNAPSSAPVPARAAFSAGPSVLVMTARLGRNRQRHREQSEQCPPGAAASGDDAEQRRIGGDEQAGVEPAGALPAKPDGQRALVGSAVGLDVPHVVDDQDRGGEAADGDREPERQPIEPLELDVVGAVHRDQPEEEEDEELAEPGVAVGPGAARVEHPRRDRGDAHGDDHPAGDHGQVDARGDGHAEGEPGRDQDAARRDQSGGGDADRAEPIDRVGAALGVRVVVGEVGSDLDEDRADQGGDEGADPPQVAMVLDRGGRPDQHGRDCRRQRPRTRRHQPDPQVRASSDTWRSPGCVPADRRCGPPGPPPSCRRAGSRRGRAAECRRGRPRWR